MAKKKPAAAKSAASKQVVYLRDDLPTARRQPKTDLLVLARFLKDEGTKQFPDEAHVADAHAVLVKWADLESSGRLDEFTETQLQGNFLAEVFGEALGYALPVEGSETYYQIQHHPIAPQQTPDAVLGKFQQGGPRDPLAVIELKGPATHLDRDRSGGRTAVDQCWDYLVNTRPTCRWGIVSNIVSFRLYERDSTKRAYEHFSLQELRDRAAFRRFYALFHRNGLVEGVARELPRAVRLVRETNDRQREVSDALYDSYSKQRFALIEELHHKLGHSVDLAVEMAQRLLDRIIFIAFCEDRRLLPEKTIAKAYAVNGFSAAVNPKWQSFKTLFRFVDGGHPKSDIDAYNGGLFAAHPVDGVELADEWTEFFKNVAGYDFADEVNLEVLGHLFEQSITELERLKERGLLAGDRKRQRQYAEMPQSVRRKQLGIYYTPSELTQRIVQYTVDELIDERFAAAAVRFGVDEADAKRGAVPDDAEFWRECLGILRDLKIVDPACGSGAFLFQAYNLLEQRYLEVIGHLEKFDPPAPSPFVGRVGYQDRSGSLPLVGRAAPQDHSGSLPSAGRVGEGGAAGTSVGPGTRRLTPPLTPPHQGEGNGGELTADQLAADVARMILNENLYGVDLSPEAVEITQLALWIRSATRGQTLATLSQNIVHGNSLVHDAAVHPKGFDWRGRFPGVFDRKRRGGVSTSDPPAPSPSVGRDGEGGDAGTSVAPGARGNTPPPTPPHQGEGSGATEHGFDCVIGNPPWERIKLQEREFFSLSAPQIATATNAAKRRQLVAKLESENPPLYARYQEAQAASESLLDYCRKSGQYPLTGKGDINLYAVFAELAYNIVAPQGRVGLLTPSGIASDNTTKDFFAAIAESNRLIRLYDFENRLKVYFPDIDNRFKFCILNFAGAASKRRSADFVFFAHRADELEDKSRHIKLSGDDIRLLNPNTRTCPIFRTKRDAEITKAIYRRVPVLIDHNREGPTGNPWGVAFKRMFDQTNDAELFREAATLQADGFKLRGNHWVKGKQTYLPLYEAKMVQAYDHRAADVVTDEANWVRQGQTAKSSLVSWQNPEHLATPRFWIDAKEVDAQFERAPTHYLGYKDVTSPTNQRTMIAAMLPHAGVVNSAPLVFSATDSRRECCLLANLNSLAYDFVMRQKISNVHLNFFVVEQVPALPPDAYVKSCPWSPRTKLETWISERVLKLSCTAEDMLPLAEACAFAGGSFQKEYGGRLNKWDPEERARLMAELDAAYLHLYGIDRDDAEYILSTFKGIHDRSELFADHQSTAEQILALYDELGA